jgi:two-component system nitrogen regulation sensor histidine kinase GlnL
VTEIATHAHGVGQALAADLAAFPVLVVGADCHVSWANAEAETWLGVSLHLLRKSRLAELSPLMADLERLIQTVFDENRDLSVKGAHLSPSHGAGHTTPQIRDLHIRLVPEMKAVVLSAGPQQSTVDASHDAALGFGRMLAHELKNPLASLRGAAQLIERETDIVATQELASHIIEDVDRMTRLAEHWSSVGDIKLGAVSKISLNQIAMMASRSFHRADPDGPQIAFQFDPSLPEAAVDIDLLHQAVVNLLQNARDALPEESGAIVLVTRYDSGPESRVDDKLSPLVISIMDNGRGVDEALAAGVFTPFVTTKPAGEGLGLAFAARVASLHSGRIDHDRLDGMTRFNIRVPICADEAG